ncbi:MAG: GGDEF domain-containing protein, partial [Calditrichia bacterium]
HLEYEKSLVNHLTGKIEELETINQKLEKNTQRIQRYNEYLESVMAIITRLQACDNAQNLKTTLINEICHHFHYQRCIFLDVDAAHGMFHINYATGISAQEWNSLKFSYEAEFYENLFKERQLIWVPDASKIENKELRSYFKEFGISRFIFAYLGTPAHHTSTREIRKTLLPMLEYFMPSLYDQQETDVENILDNLEAYLSSENFYRGGFVIIDTTRTRHKMFRNEIGFLETLFRAASYMYQNQRLMEQLHYLFFRAEKEAITDSLTNLFNYRYFIQQLNREISRTRRHGTSFSLIMMDIDHFKKVNDRYGHQVGDEILKDLAKTMMENTRTSDVVARYGGEEFAIICPELSTEGACQMAEKIRQIISHMEFKFTRGALGKRITVSLGVATFPANGESAYQLIQNADRALYRAKNSGRNQVQAVNQI